MNPKIFEYYNLFPPDVSEAGRFLLCVLAFVAPLEEKAICRIMKGVISDDNLSMLLRSLTESGYATYVMTGEGTLYGLTAKALAYLDVDREEAHHRATPISYRMLATHRLRGEIVAAVIVRITAALYLEAWTAQTAEWRRDYLAENRLPAIPDALDTTTIDLLPRSLVSTSQLAKGVANAISTGAIPFTHQHTIFTYITGDMPPLLHLLHTYDGAQTYKRRLVARHKVPGAKPTTEQVKAYNNLTRQIKDVTISMKGLIAKTALFTYKHGARVLSLAVLRQNGIFVEKLTTDGIRLGILNDTPDGGLPVKALARRLDFCVTLADNLGVAPSVSIYTLPSDAPTTKKALPYALKRLGSAFQAPPIQWVELPDTRPCLKYLSKQQYRESTGT